MNSLMNRVVIMAGFFVAVLCFAWNMFKGSDLLYSAFVSLCVLFASSIVFMFAVKSIASVLFKHLHEKKLQQIAQERRVAQEKAAAKQQ